MEDSFWPKLEAESVITPLSILKEQGKKLQEMTNGVLLYEVSNKKLIDGTKELMLNEFYIVAPLLDNIKYMLFSIAYPSISVFPLNFKNVDTLDIKNTINISNWESFNHILKSLLRDKHTKIILENLLAHSKEASTV